LKIRLYRGKQLAEISILQAVKLLNEILIIYGVPVMIQTSDENTLIIVIGEEDVFTTHKTPRRRKSDVEK
jgi:hypothetical protein